MPADNYSKEAIENVVKKMRELDPQRRWAIRDLLLTFDDGKCQYVHKNELSAERLETMKLLAEWGIVDPGNSPGKNDNYNYVPNGNTTKILNLIRDDLDFNE